MDFLYMHKAKLLTAEGCIYEKLQKQTEFWRPRYWRREAIKLLALPAKLVAQHCEYIETIYDFWSVNRMRIVN